MNRETALQNKIIVALCERGCYAVNHTVGNFYTKYGGRVSVGQHGDSDIRGHRPSGYTGMAFETDDFAEAAMRASYGDEFDMLLGEERNER